MCCSFQTSRRAHLKTFQAQGYSSRYAEQVCVSSFAADALRARQPLGHVHQPGAENWLRFTSHESRQIRHRAMTPASNTRSIPCCGSEMSCRPRSSFLTAARIGSTDSVRIHSVHPDHRREQLSGCGFGPKTLPLLPAKRFTDLLCDFHEPAIDFERTVRGVDDSAIDRRMSK